MHYPGITTDEKGRALECPVCKNSDLFDEGYYCIICGTRLTNLCLTAVGPVGKRCGNNAPLPGNARHCPECGEKTTFFQKGFLWPWGKYLHNLLKISDAG